MEQSSEIKSVVSSAGETTLNEWSSSTTVPVAAMRNVAPRVAMLWNATNAVFGGVTGPYSVAKQCMCSGVYL